MNIILSTLFWCCVNVLSISQFSLPSPCTDEDANMLLHIKYQTSTVLRLFKSTVVTKQFLQTCLDVFGPLIQEKADKVHLVNQLHNTV